MNIELMNVEKCILEEIAEKEATRDSIATTYAFGIRQKKEIDWKKVNRAIIDRWSLSALKYIKEKAWRMNQ